MAELLDLDAEVLHSYLSDVTAWIEELAADGPPGKILDLGSGTGTGTFALLERFRQAEVIAVDLSDQFLKQLMGKARARGMDNRVLTIQADLDTGFPSIAGIDLAWAASSLHHLADPLRILTDVFNALRRGGLLVVVEMASFPRFLPEDLGVGRPGLESRCHAVMAEGQAVAMPNLGSDWGHHLSQAGFTIEAERNFVIDLTKPLPASAGRYARASLQRLRSHLKGDLVADDLATLDILIDGDGPAGVTQRDDLNIRTTRVVWVARRL